MWNDHRSVILSQLSVLLSSIALLGVIAFAPSMVHWLVGFSRAHLERKEVYFFVTIYSGAIPAVVLFYSLFRLLQRISAKQVFLTENVNHLRRISWSCFAGFVICFVSTLYYFPWILVAVPAGFMALIVRVVKNVIAQAVFLQHEVDYTV